VDHTGPVLSVAGSDYAGMIFRLLLAVERVPASIPVDEDIAIQRFLLGRGLMFDHKKNN